MEETNPSISVTAEGDVLLVAFLQNELIELKYLDEAYETICRLIQDRTQPKIVLDMGNITYLSSSGLGMLVKLIKSLGKSGGRLCFANPCERLTEIFETASLDQIVSLCASTEEALAVLRDST